MEEEYFGMAVTKILTRNNPREKMFILACFFRCFSRGGKGMSEFMAIGMHMVEGQKAKTAGQARGRESI